MTRVAVTGVGGFLASHVLETVLSGTDWDVVAVDSFRHNGGTDRVADAVMAAANDTAALGEPRTRVADKLMTRVRVVTHDLAAPFSPQQIQQIGTVDYVIHAAARSSVDHSLRDPVGHVKNNIDSTLTMLDLAARIGPARYLHISTDEVFGWPHQGGTGHNPSSPYAASKAACEDLVIGWRSSFSVPATIINSQNLFGERQSQAAFIPKVIGAIRDGNEVQIHTGYGGKPASRWYTYAPNLAEYLVTLLTAEELGGRVMVPGQTLWSMDQLAYTIGAMMGREPAIRMVPGQAARGGGFDATYERLHEDYDLDDWEPTLSALDGLQRTVDWFHGNQEWLA